MYVLMNAITYSDLRRNLKQHMDSVYNNREPLIVMRKNRENVVMVSLDDFNAWQETHYLLASQANARHLGESHKQAREGKLLRKKLIEI